MSPNHNKLSLKKSRGHEYSGRGGRGNGRNQPPSRSGYVAQDLNAKQYNNESTKVYVVVPGDEDMTKSLSLATIPKNRFIVGSNHKATHNTIKQTVFDIFINSLSTVFTIESKLEEAFHAIIDLHYNGGSVSDNTFRFAPQSTSGKTGFFTFPAVTCYILQDALIPNIVFCVCPPSVINAIWELSDAILADNIFDNELKDTVPFFSPPIKQAHSVYANLPNDTPVKKLSTTCFQDHYGRWNSSITLYSK